MSPLEERLRRLEPRALPDEFWEGIRSKSSDDRRKRLRLKELVPLAAGLAIFATLLALLATPRRPGPEGTPLQAPSTREPGGESTRTLLEKLGSGQSDVRDEAARRIKDRFPEARPEVLGALGDPNPLVRERASLLLVEMVDYETQVRDEAIHLLFHATLDFEARRYHSAATYVDALRAIDPGFSVAGTLLGGLRDRRDGSEPPADLTGRVRTWKENLQSPGDSSPLAGAFRLPRFTSWTGLLERIRTKILAGLPGADEEPCPFARTMHLLSTKKVDMSMEQVPLEKGLAVLGEASGLRIWADPSARTKADFKTTILFKTADLSVKNTLRLLLEQFGLASEVSADGSVRVFARTRAGEK